jgi:hypothetical protein
LLIGREGLEDGKIENDEIRDDEIRDNEKDIETTDCEKFFLNYINRCAVSLHSANLIIDRAAIKITNTY